MVKGSESQARKLCARGHTPPGLELTVPKPGILAAGAAGLALRKAMQWTVPEHPAKSLSPSLRR